MTYPTVDEALKALQGPDGIDCPQCGRIFRDACKKKQKMAEKYTQLKDTKGATWKMAVGKTIIKEEMMRIPGGLKHFDANFAVDASVGLDKCLNCKENDNERREKG